MADTPINITIDNETVLDYFDSVSIKFSEGTYCNSIDISVNSSELWEKFDPISNFGKLNIKVALGEMNYEFMCEERSANVPVSGIAFTIWGRSAQALLDKPYSKWINDEKETHHPWQDGDVTVKTIISYVLNQCCSAEVLSKVQVHWNVLDYIVYKDSFSCSHSTPIEIISNLAGIIGAELIPNADGSLSINEYSVKEEVSIQDYNDMDHITSLSDDIVYPEGYNSVTINGFTNTSETGSASLSPVLQEDKLKGWEYGKRRTVRCFYYHPKGLKVEGDVLYGSLSPGMSGVYTFTEWILLVWGEGNTQYPNLSGETAVRGNQSTAVEFRKVSYKTAYRDFYLSSLCTKYSDPDNGIAAFYFSDRSCTSTLGFDYYDVENDTEDDTEGYDLALEWDEEDSSTAQISTAKIKTNYKFRVYIRNPSQISKCFDSCYNNLNVGGMYYERITEIVNFTNGESSLKKPYAYGMTYTWKGFSSGNISTYIGKNKITCTTVSEEYPFAIAEVSYYTQYSKGSVEIPLSFTGISFYVYVRKNRKYDTDKNPLPYEYLSISKTIENLDITETVEEQFKNISLVIKDFATEIVIPNTAVTIDGSYVGVTDINGVINISNISVGDHTIRLISQGYLDSDEDELANDTFTVS